MRRTYVCMYVCTAHAPASHSACHDHKKSPAYLLVWVWGSTFAAFGRKGVPLLNAFQASVSLFKSICSIDPCHEFLDWTVACSSSKDSKVILRISVICHALSQPSDGFVPSLKCVRKSIFSRSKRLCKQGNLPLVETWMFGSYERWRFLFFLKKEYIT